MNAAMNMQYAFLPQPNAGTRIKVCGITTVEDALTAVNLGADFLGLIFVPDSLRSISAEQAREIIHAVKLLGSNDQLLQDVQCVGVFQNSPSEIIEELLRTVPLDWIQLHGQETVEACRKLSRPIIKTLTIAPDTDSLQMVQRMNTFLRQPQVQAILLDLPKHGRKPAPAAFEEWLGRLYVQGLSEMLHFLAGGLLPETVGNIVRTFQPWAVDVASGVESSPGVKDPVKLAAFCQAVRNNSIRESM